MGMKNIFDLIKCSCKDKDCPIRIVFDEDRLWFTGKDNKETLMYLDANVIVNLIKQLKGILNKMGDLTVI